MQQEPTKNTGKHFRKRNSTLTIEVDDDNVEEFRVQSATNASSKPINFNTMESSRQKVIDNTIMRLQRLEQEKGTLLHDLERLREGAVSALVEKQQLIERLKEKVEEVVQSKEAMGEEKQREYTGLLAQLEQAVSEVQQYKKQVQALRQEHTAEVTKRDALIMELGEQLENAKMHLLQLSQSEKTLSEKYNQAQSEKEELEDELVRSKVNLSMLRESLSQSQPAVSESGRDNHSMKSHNLPVNRADDSHYRLKTDESLEMGEPNRQAWEKIELQELERLRVENEREKERHAREMEELKKYYEEKLQDAIKAKQNQPRTLPKSISAASIPRRNHQQQQQRPQAMVDLRNQLLTNLRTEGSCQQDNQSQEMCPQQEDVDKSEECSQFSSKYFSYDKTDNFLKDAKKKSRQSQHDVIQETPPSDEKDPTLTEWVKTLGWTGLLIGSLVVTGILFVFRRQK